jgi:glycosyltransferase involved in cell wall biosynthesis
VSIPAGSHRILLVSYHFGQNGATGGFRWHGLVELLGSRGWAFDVLCATGAVSADADPMDPTLAARGPLEIFPVASDSAGGALVRSVEGLPRRIRGAARPGPMAADAPGRESLAPGTGDATRVDPEAVTVWHPGHRPPLHSRIMREVEACAEALEIRAWAREAARVGRALMARRDYRLIIVSSPPHGTQVAGVELSRTAGAPPLVADLRDPWVLGLGRFAGILPAFTRTLGRRQERRLIDHADVLIHNTERHRAALDGEMGPGRRPDQWVIRNGYDGEEEPGPPDPQVFRMVFAGWLHPFMDVRAFLRGAGELVRRNGLSPAACRVEFVGTGGEFGGVSLAGLAGAYGLEGYVDLVPRVSRELALSLQARASVLVAFDCLHPLCIPMKFFDYAPMRGRLLLIGNQDGAMADAAAQLGVAVCPVDDEAAVDRVLQGALDDWRSGQTWPVNDPDGLFRRRAQADALHRRLIEMG